MRKHIFASTFALACLLASQGHAGDVADAIASGTLKATDAVAYIVYGVENGGNLPFPEDNGKVWRVSEPSGFEINYADGPTEIISVQKRDDCNYTIQYQFYRYGRGVVVGLPPTKAVFDLDFSKVVRTSVVQINQALVEQGTEPPLKSQIVGLGCTPRENGERPCEALANSAMATAADGATLLKTFSYFREKFCPRQ